MFTCSAECAQWAQAIGTIFLGFVAVFVAVYQDAMRAWIMRPELDVSIDVKLPNCMKVPLCRHDTQEPVADTYQLSLTVVNNGGQRAELVEVFASKLERQQSDDTFKEVDSFLPANLVWAGPNEASFFPAISPEMWKHWKLLHIIDPQKRRNCRGEDNEFSREHRDKTILSFDVDLRPNTGSYLLPSGTYRLRVAVAAANAKPVWKTVEISLDGHWYDDEQTMFEKGVVVRIL